VKVLLINPPATMTLSGNLPTVVDEERGHNPPLGILYLAAFLRREKVCDVEVIDAQVEELDYPALKERIRNVNADMVGISAMTFTLLDCIKVARIVKELHPKIPIAWGGSHIHIYADETIRLPEADFCFTGEGEHAFVELIKVLHKPDEWDKIQGLVFRRNGKVVRTPTRKLLANDDLDLLPFPARELVPYQKYSSVMAKRDPITTMFTSRGCPFRCSFCDRPHLGKNFRANSPSYVVNEMEECINMGIREFLIYDDTFTVDKKRVHAICDEILRRKLDIGWDVRAKVNTIDADLLKHMKAAHCERIHYGVEAGTDRIMKVLRKGITTEETRKVFKMTKEAGIDTLAYFMIGSPSETRDEIRQTFEFMQALDPDYTHITILTPFPATEIYYQGLSSGLLKEDYWKNFALNPNPEFKPKFWTEILTEQELQQLIVEAYRSFYSRPSYIFKKMVQLRSFAELRRKVKAGFRILTMSPAPVASA
jgi:anaerobic magnesium-protoporphyrin IX monomethyl ester cyclase